MQKPRLVPPSWSFQTVGVLEKEALALSSRLPSWSNDLHSPSLPSKYSGAGTKGFRGWRWPTGVVAGGSRTGAGREGICRCLFTRASLAARSDRVPIIPRRYWSKYCHLVGYSLEEVCDLRIRFGVGWVHVWGQTILLWETTEMEQFKVNIYWWHSEHRGAGEKGGALESPGVLWGALVGEDESTPCWHPLL